MWISPPRPATLAALLLALVSACGEGASDEVHAEGEPTGAVCPSASILTYENFGAPFMQAYCTRCHSSDRKGDDRNDAPLGHDFDSLNGIRTVSNHIDERAAAGPDAVNTIMPPNGDKPNTLDRTKLGEWLACGAPK